MLIKFHNNRVEIVDIYLKSILDPVTNFMHRHLDGHTSLCLYMPFFCRYGKTPPTGIHFRFVTSMNMGKLFSIGFWDPTCM